jgi:6,7-dimethyl-8-ribityllumazine synthase
MDKILIVISDYYEEISYKLLESALRYFVPNFEKTLFDEIRKYHASQARLVNLASYYDISQFSADIWICFVPGCLEIPIASAILKDKLNYNGLVALGCVIKGETTHYDIVCNESIGKLTEFCSINKIPLGNGILTTLDEPQAYARTQKGGEAIKACLELMKLKKI